MQKRGIPTCKKHACPRRIFTESFPAILSRYARQTDRLRSVLLEMAHLGSAEGAARVGSLMGFLTSGDSLLRQQRRETITVSEPRAIGVDEFAFRRGAVYGTIIVDLERHRPVEVLDSDQAEPFSNWLKAHPTIEVITRDRDESYAMAGRLSAPGAMQVADRFHLVRNAGEALKMLCQSRKWQLTGGEIGRASDEPVAPPGATGLPVATPGPNQLKLARWQAVREKRAAGYSLKAIARELGMGRHTVSRYLSQENPPICHRARHPALVSPFLSYLRQKWEEGCHDGRVLYREIVGLGYRGKLTQIYEALHSWREYRYLPPPQPPPPPLSRWVLWPTPEEKDRLDSILALNPPLSTGYRLKEQFAEIVHQRDVNGLLLWVTEAANCGLKPFQGVAASIKRDFAAVRNAVSLPWSNAQCEGQICRVKQIKRAGYGRAKIDLLRQRILHRMPAN